MGVSTARLNVGQNRFVFDDANGRDYVMTIGIEPEHRDTTNYVPDDSNSSAPISAITNISTLEWQDSTLSE